MGFLDHAVNRANSEASCRNGGESMASPFTMIG